MALMNSMDMKEFTDNGLMEIAGLTSRREYNLSLVKSRQLAEHLVKSYAEECMRETMMQKMLRSHTTC